MAITQARPTQVRRDLVVGIKDPARITRRRRRWAVYGGRVAFLLLVLGSWQFFGPKIGEVIASSPLAVAQALINWAQSGRLLDDLGATLEEMAIGYLIGAAVGIFLGIVLATADYPAAVLEPFILAVYGIPMIALAPLMIVWFGLFLLPKIILSAILVFFFVFFSTFNGIRGVDSQMVQSVRLMGASPFDVRRLVMLPGALPGVLLGLKLGVPQALVGAVVAEFISSTKGIGYEIQFASAQLDTASVFAALIVLGTLALVLNGVVNGISRIRIRS